MGLARLLIVGVVTSAVAAVTAAAAPGSGAGAASPPPRAAGSVVFVQAVPGADLECSFELTGDAIAVAVSVMTLTGEQPARDTFAWTVLTALAGEVDSTVDADSRVTLSLRKRRGDALDAPAVA